MLRISQETEHNVRPTFRLEGRIVGPWVEELRQCCQAASEQGDGLVLDLRSVSFVDASGLSCLKSLLEDGAEIVNCSGYIAELLRQIHAGNGRTPSAAELRGQEREWIHRLRAGDNAAYEWLVRKHTDRMLAVARRILECEDAAADAVQDAFISAFRAIDSFQGDSLLGTWLHRIVVNASLIKLRDRKPRREASIDSLLPAFDETGHHMRPVPPWDVRPEDALERSELRAQVRKCIDQLPHGHREILILRDIEELHTEATAELLGISPGAVKTRLHRARQALRTLLEPVLRI